MLKSRAALFPKRAGPDLTPNPVPKRSGPRTGPDPPSHKERRGELFAVHNCKVLILARSETDKIGTALIPLTGDEHGPDLHPYPRFQERSGADIPQ